MMVEKKAPGFGLPTPTRPSHNLSSCLLEEQMHKHPDFRDDPVGVLNSGLSGGLWEERGGSV